MDANQRLLTCQGYAREVGLLSMQLKHPQSAVLATLSYRFTITTLSVRITSKKIWKGCAYLGPSAFSSHRDSPLVRLKAPELADGAGNKVSL